ncbi:MAG: class I SAM-dependent rRNA methyltransferase [Flammeovirgaceae bacterium]|nr:MAG: class I SAM-dependent rRNA methyltransferase [Flammeovirgaceae bacterium]
MISGKLRLKPGKEQSLKRFHPWVFSGAIHSTEGNPADGEWVEVADARNKTIGFGHYQKGSITVRMLSFNSTLPAENFWTTKIETAVALRLAAGLPIELTNAFRLIHAEGDGLPGLIIDYYNGVAVMQAHSAGMHIDRKAIADALQSVLQEKLKAVYYKSRSTLPARFRTTAEDEYIHGMGAVPHLISENGNRFYVDWEGGQKTGFFLDQRDNRSLLGSYAKNKTVLNTFCYTGGFSVYALTGGAKLVHSVDVSEKAIEATRQNIELNGFSSTEHACFTADSFEYMERCTEAYDLIILDPPAFAKHRDARHQAMKGYQRLNTIAMKKINPGGIIFTFSCSQVVDRQLFYDTVVSAALNAGREINVLHRLGQPADHPVSIYHPEGEYLKGLVLYVH